MLFMIFAYKRYERLPPFWALSLVFQPLFVATGTTKGPIYATFSALLGPRRNEEAARGTALYSFSKNIKNIKEMKAYDTSYLFNTKKL